MSPADRQIRLIERSLDCFRCGVVGLLPVIGALWAMLAIRGYFLTRSLRQGLWNPAGHLALIGYLLGFAGLLWFAIQVVAVFLVLANHLT